MHNTSALYQEILAGEGGYNVECKVEINGTIYGMDKIVSMKTSRAAFGNGTLSIGLAPSAEIQLSVIATSSSIARMAELKPYYRIVNDANQRSEWIPKGTFFIDTRKQLENGVLEITGYDAMLKAERTQPWSDLSWPALDIDAVMEIAGIIGVNVDATITSYMTAGFRIPMPVTYTMRETLQYIAALYGGSFIISETNTLQLIQFWRRNPTSSIILDTSTNGASMNLEVSPAFPACTGVRFITGGDSDYSAGSTSGYVFEISCPWANAAAATWLYNQIGGFVYRPFSSKTACIDPAIEIGDTISVSGSLTNIFSCDFNFDSLGACDIACPGEESLDHEYPFQSSTERAYVRKMNGFQSELSQQASQISAKVSRTGGDPRSFAWYLDADHFALLSNEHQVMYVDDSGLTVTGTINATAGNIGGCTIENGLLQIANANIGNINANKITAGTISADRIGAGSITNGKLGSNAVTGDKIAGSTITGAKIAAETLNGGHLEDYTLGSYKLYDGAAVNRVIGNNAVSYAKTSFQGTLDQVGTNTANIDTLYGYFTGSAHFQNCQIDGIFMFAGKYIGTTQKTVDNRTLYYLEWRDP